MGTYQILMECHIQVHSSRNYIPVVGSPPKHTSPPSMVATFLTTHLIVVLQPLGIPSSTVEILLFSSVFHDRVTPVSILTLKPPLGVIEVLPLKP